MMRHQQVFMLALSFLMAMSACAQELTQVPFDSGRWELTGDDTKVTEYKGQKSLYMKRGAGLLRDAAFENGTVEFDIVIPEDRGFPGVFFRMENDSNYEEFYVRPHQSGNPDASQYSPVNNGVSGWQLYHGEGYSAQVEYLYDTWMPVKLVVSGDKADIYINDMAEPFLHVNDLKRMPLAGGLGLKGSPTGVYFANFRYSTQTSSSLIGQSKPEERAGEHTVTQWAVSETLAESDLEGNTELAHDLIEGLTWGTHETEPSGMLNLATTAIRTPEQNTVFTRLTLTSAQRETQKMTLSFSDRVRVYLNGKILFSARDGFISRDYRFLGTVGDFDDVYLPLNEGNNTLVIAVSEDFGGWGLRARFGDLKGFSWTAQ